MYFIQNENFNISNRVNKNLHLKNGEESILEKQSINKENLSYSQNGNFLGNNLYNDNENALLIYLQSFL